jgi:hypothetical protein
MLPHTLLYGGDLSWGNPMRLTILAALLACLIHPAVHAVPILPVIHDLSGAVPIEVASDPEPEGTPPTLPPIGDTYSGAPIVQGNGAFYMRSPGVTTHTFDGSPEAAGANLFGAAGDTFVVTESVTLSGDILTVRTRWTNINSDGNPAPWVAAGVVSPNGDTLLSWRLDVAALDGGSNTIDVPGFGYIPGTGIARALNSAGSQIGAGGLSHAPPGGASALRGAAAFARSNNDIAGFDLAAIRFEWQLEPLPSITSVNPDFGPDFGGTSVTITGDHFHADASASFGGVDCTGIVVTVPDTLTCVTPAGTAGLVDVTVTNPSGGSGTLVDGYEYVAGPSISSISPESGLVFGGFTVVISGDHFQTGAQVFFNGTACGSVVVNPPNSISCTAPPGPAGAVDVTVQNPDGQSDTLALGFTYRDLETRPVPTQGALALALLSLLLLGMGLLAARGAGRTG